MKRFVFSLALFSAAGCLAQLPPNDDFTNRISLAGSSFILAADTTGATLDLFNEPCYSRYLAPRVSIPCAPTLWWKWTPIQSSQVVIERIDANSNVLGYLGVYATTNMSGSSSGDQIAGIHLQLHGQFAVFNAQAGTEYQISVASIYPELLHFRFTSTNAPVFRVQPLTQTVTTNASTLFSALAVGIGPLRYQWRRDGADIQNATNHMISFENVNLGDAGDYCVAVTGPTGASTSQVAHLNVTLNDSSPALRALGVGNGTGFQFSVTGEVGRRYRMEQSSDLLSWASPDPGGVIINTNATSILQIKNESPTKFVRFSTYHAENEICVNRLRQIQTAIRLCADDNHLDDTADIGIGLNHINEYLIDGKWPQCPLALDDYPRLLTLDVATRPTCAVVPWSHILLEP